MILTSILERESLTKGLTYLGVFGMIKLETLRFRQLRINPGHCHLIAYTVFISVFVSLSVFRWVREFLNEENKGLDVLVEYLSFAQYAVT